jgi:hypothetical protein
LEAEKKEDLISCKTANFDKFPSCVDEDEKDEKKVIHIPEEIDHKITENVAPVEPSKAKKDSALAKKKPKERKACGRKVRLFFQDEASFGRISVPRYSWCKKGHRPAVCKQRIREYRDVFAAVEANGRFYL